MYQTKQEVTVMKKKYAAILLSAVTAVSGMGGVLPVSAAEDGEITEIRMAVALSWKYRFWFSGS